MTETTLDHHATNGRQFGSSGAAADLVTLRSPIYINEAHNASIITGVSITAAATGSAAASLIVKVGGVEVINVTLTSTLATYQSEPLTAYGHVEILFNQPVSMEPLYLKSIQIANEAEPSALEAALFAREVEASDTCLRSDYLALIPGYDALSSAAKGYLSSYMVDDAGEQDTMTALAKYQMMETRFGNQSYYAPELEVNRTIIIVITSFLILSILAILVVKISVKYRRNY
jgi:hypothetical protein